MRRAFRHLDPPGFCFLQISGPDGENRLTNYRIQIIRVIRQRPRKLLSAFWN